MATRQRKVERKRLKRQKRNREKQVLKLRYEKRMTGDAAPLYRCLGTRDWRAKGLTCIFVARELGADRLAMAAFLVDVWAMGLKDAWGRTDLTRHEFNELASRFEEASPTAPMSVETARHLVYGGIELARDLGFRLPRRYERWTAMLGPLPSGESPDMSLFLHNGQILVVSNMRDLEARLVGTTPARFLSRPDVHFMLGDDDFTLVDEEDEEYSEEVDRIEEAMVEQAQQWCFANGQRPHPLLPAVIGASLEAASQGLACDADSDADLETPSDEEQEEAAEQALSFLWASFQHDPAGLEAAMAQFTAFMHATGGPDKFLEAFDLPDPDP